MKRTRESESASQTERARARTRARERRWRERESRVRGVARRSWPSSNRAALPPYPFPAMQRETSGLQQPGAPGEACSLYMPTAQTDPWLPALAGPPCAGRDVKSAKAAGTPSPISSGQHAPRSTSPQAPRSAPHRPPCVYTCCIFCDGSMLWEQTRHEVRPRVCDDGGEKMSTASFEPTRSIAGTGSHNPRAWHTGDRDARVRAKLRRGPTKRRPVDYTNGRTQCCADECTCVVCVC